MRPSANRGRAAAQSAWQVARVVEAAARGDGRMGRAVRRGWRGGGAAVCGRARAAPGTRRRARLRPF